jgi:hypothetical protein
LLTFEVLSQFGIGGAKMGPLVGSILELGGWVGHLLVGRPKVHLDMD